MVTPISVAKYNELSHLLAYLLFAHFENLAALETLHGDHPRG